MKLLLDTCVISELNRAEGNPSVRSVIAASASDNLFLSVITLGEIMKGIQRLPTGKRKKELTLWFNGLIDGFGERILPVSSQTSILWGTLTAKAQEQGYILPVADGLIAATALNHNLTVVTRNVRDFAPAGVKMIDPWSV